MKTNKRVLAILMSLIMMVAYVPALAYAGEGEVPDAGTTGEAAAQQAQEPLALEEPDEIVPEEIIGDDESEISIKSEPSTDYSGYCGADGGKNVSWSFDPNTGLLTLTGSGEMDTCNDEEFWGQVDVVPWYNYRSQITSVSIGNGITFIGWWAFAHTNITEVTFPSSVKTIGQGALAYCYNLRTVNLNDGLQSIEGSVFAQDTLSTLVLPASMTKINATAFHDANIGTISVRGSNPGLRVENDVIFSADRKHLFYCKPSKTGSYSIPTGVEVIEEYAFWGSRLSHVTIPGTVKTICGRAFAEAYLQEIIIPDSVTKMEYGAFTRCDRAKSIVIGDGLTSLEMDVFGENYSVTEIHFGANIRTIGDSAFRYAESLESVVIPESVTTIDEEAFYHCTSLTEVTLPQGLRTVGKGAFYDTALTSVTVPDSVTSIGQYAFPEEAEVTLPAGIFSDGAGGYVTMSDLAPVEISAKYGQTEARSMLSMVNSLRTGSNAWYWNENNTKKIQLTNLQSYTYDYNLEKIAMLRAVEIGLRFAHERPNGTICFTAFDGNGSFSNYGENIAIGYGSAASAFAGWSETNEKYAGQGHRRNMLSEDFNTIGIGCAVINGTKCWVQEFGYTSTPNTSATAANNAVTTVQVYVSKSIARISSIAGKFSRTRIEVGETINAPIAEMKFTTDSSWAGTCTGTIRNISWTSANDSIASIEGDTVTGNSEGIATFTASVLGKTVTARLGIGQDLPAVSNEIVCLPGVKLSKVKAGKKSMTVKWKKVSKKKLKKIKKIQIQYSTDPSFGSNVKTVAVKAKKKSKKIKKLQKGKKYYVRIRAYTSSNGVVKVSKWSKRKSVKIK